MREQFCAASIPFLFFDAFEGDNVRLEDHFSGLDRTTYRLNTYRSPLPGEIGCYASHLALWKLAVRLGEPIVVLEDDCRLESDFCLSLRIASTLVESLGFIRLEQYRRSTNKLHLGRRHSRILTIGTFDVHYLLDVPLCLLAYALSPSAAAQLIRASEILKSPVDKLMQRTWEHDVPIYALSPSPVAKSSCAEHSTIGDRSRRQRNLITMIRRAVYKLRGELRKAAFNRSHLLRLRSASCGLKIDIERLIKSPV